MRTLGNILWHFPFFGFVTAIFTYILGIILIFTVVAAPIGLGLTEYGKFLFSPFGTSMVSKKELNAPYNKLWDLYSTLVWILYLPFGLILCAVAIVQIGLLFVSIAGIPVAMVLAKSLSTFLNPVDKKCVPYVVMDELQRRKDEKIIEQYLGKK